MDTPPPQKKGLGPLAWLGIGCGGIIVLAVIGIAVSVMFFGPKVKESFKNLKEFGEDAVKNPTRAPAAMMVKMGLAEMVKEDDVKHRYTVKEKQSGNLTTFYWSKSKNGPGKVTGDFSAIPADDEGVAPSLSAPPATPAPAN